jgi:hypothetical protein
MHHLIEDNIPFNKFLSIAFTSEILIQFIFPYPNVESIVFIGQYSQSHVKDVAYFSSDLILVFMFTRFYTLIKHLENYREFMSMRSRKICREHGFECTSMFNFKTEIYYY